MNRKALHQVVKTVSFPRFLRVPVFYSMLNKPPTVNPAPYDLDINDEPIRIQSESRAMKVYKEKVDAYNKFMTEQRASFEIGKRHLANMMGCDPETFTQEDINEAIDYLLPCGLFDKKARPLMKPPEEVFPRKKEAEFDSAGRPFHFLFYTALPNFYQIMHDSVKLMKELDDYEDKVLQGAVKDPGCDKIVLENSKWVSLNQMEKICCERLTENQYKHLIGTLERVASHPYAKRAEEFILRFRQFHARSLKPFELLEPILLEDGRKMIRSEGCQKKRTLANVDVICPGTGKIIIHGKNIDYFKNIQSREQVLFPLVLSGMLNKVDVVAEITFHPESETATAGAIRLGISRGIIHFVDEEIKEKMKLAGLLQRDFRKRERKKAGQFGARRKHTWKKR